MRLLLIGLMLTISVTAFAEVSKESLTLSEGRHYEVCSVSKIDDVITYTFTSSDTLDFNIHYHKDGKTIYPIKQKKVSEGSGSHQVDANSGHCLMWSNLHSRDVTLDLSVSFD